MTDRRLFVLAHTQARLNAIEAVKQAHEGFWVEVKQPTRSLDQNAKLWALLGELADQVIWHGQKLSSENWKDVLTAGLKRQQVVPGVDGGFVVLGTSTRRMTKGEMAELIEFIHAFGAAQGVVFGDLVAA